MASIPTISSRATASEVQKFARAVKLFLEGSGFSSQVSGQITSALANYNDPSTPAETDLTPPGAPVSLVATGGFNHILLTWGVASGNIDHYLIYRNSTDNLADAVCISPRIPTTMWVDAPPDSRLSSVYYYWVRAVSPSGIEGPFNATAGTAAHTADEPAYILEILTGEIKEGQLYATLNERLNLIDAPS